MKMITSRRLFAILLTLSIVLTCCGCGASSETAETVSAKAASDTSSADQRPVMYDNDQYLLYQNIFFGDYGEESDGQAVEKQGVFAVLHDAFNDRERYYVWGYADQTKCCDWQWEFVPREGESLPPVGSMVSVDGTFVSDEDALDGYWIVDAHVALKAEFTGTPTDLDMYSMSCTLERVQMYNIIRHPDSFQDRAFTAYGRVASLNSLEDPYYNGSWKIDFTWDGELPGIGTLVEVSGSVQNGALTVRSMQTM